MNTNQKLCPEKRSTRRTSYGPRVYQINLMQSDQPITVNEETSRVSTEVSNKRKLNDDDEGSENSKDESREDRQGRSVSKRKRAITEQTDKKDFDQGVEMIKRLLGGKKDGDYKKVVTELFLLSKKKHINTIDTDKESKRRQAIQADPKTIELPVNEVRADNEDRKISELSSQMEGLVSGDLLSLADTKGKVVMKQVREYIKEKVYGFIKFPMGQKQQNARIIERGIEAGRISILKGVSSKTFANYHVGSVKIALSALRHNTQTLARKRWFCKLSRKKVGNCKCVS